MTKDEAIAKLQELQKCGDVDIAHGAADLVLCDFLESLGYKDIVEEWEKVEKWYA